MQNDEVIQMYKQIREMKAYFDAKIYDNIAVNNEIANQCNKVLHVLGDAWEEIGELERMIERA